MVSSLYLPHGHIFWKLYGSFQAMGKWLGVWHTCQRSHRLINAPGREEHCQQGKEGKVILLIWAMKSRTNPILRVNPIQNKSSQIINASDTYPPRRWLLHCIMDSYMGNALTLCVTLIPVRTANVIRPSQGRSGHNIKKTMGRFFFTTTTVLV